MNQSQQPALPVTPSGEFLLCACQPGAEDALHARAALVLPGVRPGAWRRGVVTLRLPEGCAPSLDQLATDLVFAHAVIQSLGQVSGDTPETLVREAVTRSHAATVQPANVHVWNRGTPAGLGAAPAIEAATAARRHLLEAFGLDAMHPLEARPGDCVLDCVIDTPTRWWVGWHVAGSVPSRWPGGMHPAAGEPLPDGIVSRAWLKLDEAIRVFEIPITAGERAIELGASPGGACQRLLEAGLHVVGVDPALVDPVVATRPHFTQWRMRAREVPLERFLGCDWLVADMNIDPQNTLAAIGRVAMARGVRLSGFIATFKVSDWSGATGLAGWLDSIRAWGFEPRARQLSTSGREITVVALHRPRRKSSRPRRANAVPRSSPSGR